MIKFEKIRTVIILFVGILIFIVSIELYFEARDTKNMELGFYSMIMAIESSIFIDIYLTRKLNSGE